MLDIQRAQASGVNEVDLIEVSPNVVVKSHSNDETEMEVLNAFLSPLKEESWDKPSPPLASLFNRQFDLLGLKCTHG
ncbi:hypothetical protein HNY73_003334 [Argiope bruennichi]|uniref:Uncharacterized protein n=1 Tax=Argiope bruennichi TaxID=94029 RepID=A0A8T0G0K6_ARGBR|nr:hypothetical protein HNY73_003334 [Argiope bruennichi]